MLSPSIGRASGPSVLSRVIRSGSLTTVWWMHPDIVLGCCLGLIVVFHWPTVVSMLHTWSQDPFGHGYFVVAAAVYLAWSRRKRVASMNPRSTYAPLPLLGFLAFVWSLATLDKHRAPPTDLAS